MKSKKISIVMSAYNAQDYLEIAIESIVNQTYENIEFIIINDGSTDKSLEIINKYAQQDGRIVVIDQNNTGLTKALNVGIQKATGNYIARMDADDLSMPNRFKNFIKYIEQNGDIELYSTPSYVINEIDEVQKIIPNYFRRNGFDQKLLNYYNSMIHGALIVNADILKKYLYNEEYKYSQDFELYHRLMSHGYKISYDKDNISYKLRVHSKSISSQQKPEQIRLYQQIFKDNNIKFYKQNIFNRILFKFIDLCYFLFFKSNLIKNVN